MKFRGTFKKNHPLAAYTSWRIGGVAKYFYQPTDLEDLALFLHDWREEPIVVFGAGTNVLIRDRGIAGLVICLRDRLQQIQRLRKNILRVEAGARLVQLLHYSIEQSWSDLAFLVGIPGTLGGALAMNAGAYGDCIWNHVVAVETINRCGEIQLRQAKEFQIDYREIHGLKREWFVAGHLQFTGGNSKESKKIMREILAKRRLSQPLNELCCGSVFRNPPNDYAARLIETCGLKGYRVGAAEISKTHANFIINKGDANTADVEELIEFIVQRVFERYGITLITEVQILE